MNTNSACSAKFHGLLWCVCFGTPCLLYLGVGQASKVKVHSWGKHPYKYEAWVPMSGFLLCMADLRRCLQLAEYHAIFICITRKPTGSQGQLPTWGYPSRLSILDHVTCCVPFNSFFDCLFVVW